MRRAMLVDLSRCVGCKSCIISCKQENEVIPGLFYNELKEKEGSDHEGFYKYTYPRSCMHCDTPTCVKVCPVGANTKKEDGIVYREPKKCVGCKYCVNTCPYNASKYNALAEKAEKCTFCIKRVRNGLKPACATNCPSDARTYGEMNDLLALAEKRKASLKAKGQEAVIYRGDKLNTSMIYLIPVGVDLPGLPAHPQIPTSVGFWQDIVQPLGKLAMGSVGAAVITSFLINTFKAEDKPAKGGKVNEG
ncbi:4Fe-4S dicluster domain-containing protein [Calderihabitans maritimus]|uniref:4Fe-4S ferredoxin n=1 Tax=Calderihabitans maritimus TaxID=1246530 RepID=A0A1Z5HRW9_9FIRM|nr:4Fe-4S dicluster domain-containing protein [Calderihabitans maritimus]GAW92020.1 4Fe-4S ferredoxin [Calderihabitans maritimus]